MTTIRRRHLANDALSGYVSGPDAPLKATELAMARASHCRAVVLVEGISDQIALDFSSRPWNPLDTRSPSSRCWMLYARSSVVFMPDIGLCDWGLTAAVVSCTFRIG